MSDSGRKEHFVNWDKVDPPFSGLETGIQHDIIVQREAIPLVFVPGIMGSNLRKAGTKGETDNQADGFPNLRWAPDDTSLMFKHYMTGWGAHRRKMLIGPSAFNKDFLEPDDNDVKDAENAAGKVSGLHAVFESSYGPFLMKLKNNDWGPLRKIFEFPVYAVGYNWTASCADSGAYLKKRINDIVKEANEIVGWCEKVILISHSMGGLVCRAASEQGAESQILGIIHGVQPVNGAAAAYWRMKGGFDSWGLINYCLGSSGDKVTPILGNAPGGLELLPNMSYRKNWLMVTNYNEPILLPTNNPYNEIYQIKGTGSEINHPDRKIWGLVDPDLLAPEDVGAPTACWMDQEIDIAHMEPWDQYVTNLTAAENFHLGLGKYAHSNTHVFYGIGLRSAESIELRAEGKGPHWDSYPSFGFQGFFKNSSGKSMRAVLQDPNGDGDMTVPTSSGSALVKPSMPFVSMEHQPAYQDARAHAFVLDAVKALCKLQYDKRRGS